MHSPSRGEPFVSERFCRWECDFRKRDVGAVGHDRSAALSGESGCRLDRSRSTRGAPTPVPMCGLDEPGRQRVCSPPPSGMCSAVKCQASDTADARDQAHEHNAHQASDGGTFRGRRGPGTRTGERLRAPHGAARCGEAREAAPDEPSDTTSQTHLGSGILHLHVEVEAHRGEGVQSLIERDQPAAGRHQALELARGRRVATRRREDRRSRAREGPSWGREEDDEARRR